MNSTPDKPYAYSTRGKRALAQAALNAGLYNKNGTIKTSLERMIKHPWIGRQEIIVVAWHRGKAIGVCHIDNANNICAYVKPFHRRAGVGSELVRSAQTLFKKPPFYLASYLGSNRHVSGEFWDAVGVVNWKIQLEIDKTQLQYLVGGRKPWDELLMENMRRTWEALNQRTLPNPT